MESTAQIAGHPIHPMAIPYPFTLLTTATWFDVIARITRRHTMARTGSQLTKLGIGCALMAAVPGVIDYFGTVPPRSRARRTATWHAVSNLSAVACFALAQARRREGRLPGADQLALQIAGTALISTGGWLGGNLVYHHHIGVVDREAEAGAQIPTEGGIERVERRRDRPTGRPRVPEPVS